MGSAHGVALDMQTLWNLGFNAMNLIALVAAILFVVAVTLILLSFLTGNKHPAAPAQAAVYEPAPEAEDEAYYDEGEADDTDGADASVLRLTRTRMRPPCRKMTRRTYRKRKLPRTKQTKQKNPRMPVKRRKPKQSCLGTARSFWFWTGSISKTA